MQKRGRSRTLDGLFHIFTIYARVMNAIAYTFGQTFLEAYDMH
jgi:hypothetical protein